MKITHPNDHISALESYSSLFKISGAWYNNVPTSSTKLTPYYTKDAIPKSPSCIVYYLLLRNILLGLTSL